MTHNFTTYHIKKGNKNFKPLESWLPIINPKGYEVWFRFHKGGWSSLKEWGGDRDWDDIQKIKGITKFFSLNSQHSSMIGFNYGEVPETYVIRGYTNYPWGDFIINKEKITIESGQIGYAKVRFKKGKALYQITVGDQTIYTTNDFVRHLWIGKEIGTYPGGGNNSAGPHGGRAFKDMSIDIDFRPF